MIFSCICKHFFHCTKHNFILQIQFKNAARPLDKNERTATEVFLKEVLSQKVWELGQVYLLKIKHTNNFILQQEEVEQVKWFGLEAFKDLLYSDNFVPYDKEYKDWIFGELKSQIKNIQPLHL